MRELAGWSAQKSTPKIAALIAMAALPEPEPAPAVEFKSKGSCCSSSARPRPRSTGRSDCPGSWKCRCSSRAVAASCRSSGAIRLVGQGRSLRAGSALRGRVAPGEPDRPRALHALQRLHPGLPRDAIGFDYQIDLAKCKDHRDCVKACGDIGAIDFSRSETMRQDGFDLVLDLSREPLIRRTSCRRAISRRATIRSSRRSPRRSWSASSASSRSRASSTTARRSARIAARGSRAATRASTCARAARSAPTGDQVKVEAHLCAGCGGCATVCPSGAMSYAYPKVPDLGSALEDRARHVSGGGRQGCLHAVPRRRRPARCFAYGRKGARACRRASFRWSASTSHRSASTSCSARWPTARGRLACSSTEKVAEGYVAALKKQMGYAQAIVNALGYARHGISLVIEKPATDAVELEPAATVAKRGDASTCRREAHHARFRASTTCAAGKPRSSRRSLCPPGAPFRRAEWSTSIPARSARPASAPARVGAARRHRDAGAALHRAQLRAVRAVRRDLPGERDHAGAAACSESAAKQPVTLNEAEPFNCVRCGKPFGTRADGGEHARQARRHSMFAGGMRRLQMCGDCRVVDMMENKSEARSSTTGNDRPEDGRREPSLRADRAAVLRAPRRSAALLLRRSRSFGRRRGAGSRRAWRELSPRGGGRRSRGARDEHKGARRHRQRRRFRRTSRTTVRFTGTSARSLRCATSRSAWPRARRRASPKTTRRVAN